MLFRQSNQNDLGRNFTNKGLARHGLKAEYIGKNAAKITKQGAYLGQVRKVIGSYCWYPNGFDQPQFRTFSPEKALSHIVNASCGNREFRPRGH